jgi:hypothetical protein
MIDDQMTKLVRRLTPVSPTQPRRASSIVLDDAPIRRVIQPPEGCRETFAVRGDFQTRT